MARAALKDSQVVLAAALTDSAPVALAGEMLTVELPEAFCTQLATNPELTRQLDELATSLAGRRLRITPRPRGGQGPGDERSRRYRAAQNHPLVQGLLNRFDADIVAREIVARDEWLRRDGK